MSSFPCKQCKRQFQSSGACAQHQRSCKNMKGGGKSAASPALAPAVKRVPSMSNLYRSASSASVSPASGESAIGSAAVPVVAVAAPASREKQLKKQDELSKEHQRKLFRAEQSENGVAAAYSAVPFVSPQGPDQERADEGVAAQNLHYFGPKGAQQSVDNLNGSNVVLDDDVLHILRVSGPVEAGRVARKLIDRGFEDIRKTDVNPILYKLQKGGKAVVESKEHVTPIWKSADAERTSYDEVVDFAKTVSAGVCVCVVPKEMQDGFRVSCTLIWDDVEGTICSTSVRLHEGEARMYAAHDLLRLLCTQRPKSKDVTTKLWQIAFERGLNFQRGAPYPRSLIEDTLREWKGASNVDKIWNLGEFWPSLSLNALPNMCGMWNTLALHPEVGDHGEIIFGLHDNGTIHGIGVPWDYTTAGDVESASMKLRVEVQNRLTDQWKSIVECAEPDGCIFSQFYPVEIVHVRPSRKKGDEQFVHFLVRIIVKKIPGLKVIRCKDLFQKRSVQGPKAELVSIPSAELMKQMQK